MPDLAKYLPSLESYVKKVGGDVIPAVLLRGRNDYINPTGVVRDRRAGWRMQG